MWKLDWKRPYYGWWKVYWQWSAWGAGETRAKGFGFWFRTPLFCFGRYYKTKRQGGMEDWTGWSFGFLPLFYGRRLYLINMDVKA